MATTIKPGVTMGEIQAFLKDPVICEEVRVEFENYSFVSNDPTNAPRLFADIFERKFIPWAWRYRREQIKARAEGILPVSE